MKVYFVNNKKIGSRVISWFTKNKGQKISDVPSHVALEFDGGLVVEAVLFSGVRINYLPNFLKDRKVNSVFEYCLKESDEALMSRVLKKYYGQGYDVAGVLWFAWVILKNKLLGRKIPKINRWHSRKRAFCNEIVSVVVNETTSHVDPNSMMFSMRSSSKFKEIE